MRKRDLVFIALLLSCGQPPEEYDYTIGSENTEIPVFCEPSCPTQDETQDAFNKVSLQVVLQTDFYLSNSLDGWTIHFVPGEWLWNDNTVYGFTDFEKQQLIISAFRGSHLHPGVFDYELTNPLVRRLLPDELKTDERYTVEFKVQNRILYGYCRGEYASDPHCPTTLF